MFSDRHLINFCSFIRSMCFGILAVVLAIFLIQLNLSKWQVGFIVSSGLFGAAFGNLAATFLADRFGKKRVLVAYALINALSVLTVCFSANFYTILVAAFFGMLNGRGKDRGVALLVETSILPSLTSPEKRTKSFAWYMTLQDIGLALGGALAGLPTLLQKFLSIPERPSFQILFCFYAVCMALTAGIYLLLSPHATSKQTVTKTCSSEGKKIVTKLASLFALDSLGSGFLTSALIAFYLYERFGVGVEAIGILFTLGRIINASSYFIAVWLSERIGLIRTMVFSHMPSHLLLIGIALFPSFPIAVVLFLLREFLVEMDVPTRQSYIMAVVKPEDRTFASGMTQVVRMGGWAFGPAIAGLIMHHFHTVAPLYIGAGLKLSYDLLLYTSFRKLKPPEETLIIAA